VTGVAVTALTVVSGAAFLRLKARDALPETVTEIGVGAVAAYLFAVAATLGALATRLPAGVDALLSPPVLALVTASVGLGVGYGVALRRGADLAALAAAAGLTYGLTAVVAVLMYPRIDPATGATVGEAVVSTLPLNLMSIGAALLLPLVAVYFAVLYSAFSGPITAEEAY
ncbi:cytochrome d ubiquinol oxidase subunit II, partial [Halorubrum sp. SD683]|uniref:cytochrome d ubiquinol oxidase subunit II n=1 Tax=Halorubrum sp. SD683 TaxID=1855873 RepID=UPI001E583488